MRLKGRHRIYLVVSILICASLFMGCTVTYGAPVEKNAGEDSLSGSLVLNGSTSMASIANSLCDGFRQAYPGVKTTVGGSGSGEGPTSVESGTAGIGMLSRALKDSEQPERFDVVTIAYDGIVICVNSQNPVKELSEEQIAAIYRGEIRSWAEVGGRDAEIEVVGREAASGTRSAFEEILDIAGQCRYSQECNATGIAKQTLAGNADAIAYLSLSDLDDTITPLSVGGVVPSEETVASGDYSIVRPFIMVYKKDSADPLILAFMEYIRTEGRPVIEKFGAVPVPA